MNKLRILVALLALAWLPASAANHYVSSAATGAGTGVDWTNACTDFTVNCAPSTYTRGDVIYVADGTYAGNVNFNKAISGTTLITIKKAIPADHGTNTGWVDTMGDGTALFNNQINFGTSNWLMDGQVGGGPGDWTGSPTAFGFKITMTSANPNLRTDAVDNITVRHIEFQGSNNTTGGGSIAQDSVGLYGATHFTISYYYAHDAGRCIFFISTQNFLAEYGYTARYNSTAAAHAELASIWGFTIGSNGVVFRYSIFTHIEGTGGLIFDNQENTAGAGMQVYGNVFYRPTSDTWTINNGVVGGWTGGNGEKFFNVSVYNNSFINANDAGGFSPLTDFPAAGNFGSNTASNNIFSNSNAVDYSVWATHQTNTETASNPFSNVTGLDFRLTAESAPGTTLPSPYNADYLAHSRPGADGVWSQGALQFVFGQSVSRTFTLTINPSVPPLSITTTSPLPGGTQGVAYNANMAATGGVPPYTWTLASGALPPGLSLSGAGAITGQPTSIGVATSVIKVTDSASTAVTGTFRITISCVPLVISSTSPLPPGTVSTPYSAQLQSQGGTGALTWSLSSGSFPTGVSISAGGLISGTPSSSGLFTPTIGLQDSCSTPQTTTQAFSLTIAASLTITTTSPLPAATPGQPYSTTLTAAGGSPPYTWAVTSGTLPAGLSLNASTGVISGTPTSAGFVQVNAATPSANSSSVPVAFLSNQASGNTNVVAVGWSDTVSTVTSVTDARGNTYTQAGSTVTGTGRRQAIYYAKNIAAGGNTVTVTLNQAAPFVDVRILEYSGLNTSSPLDVTAGAFGTSTTANSGAATTTSANEIIFGAGSTANRFTAPGGGFTSRIITTPNGDIAEDKVVSTVGSNSATATVGASAAWVMQMAAFKAVGGLGSSTFTIQVTDNAAQTVSKVFTMNLPPHTVTIAWTASTTPGVTYNVLRGTTTGGPYPVSVASGVSGLNTLDQTVQPATTYFYVVTAQSGSAISVFSNQATACVPSQPSCP